MGGLVAPASIAVEQSQILREQRRQLAPTKAERLLAWITAEEQEPLRGERMDEQPAVGVSLRHG